MKQRYSFYLSGIFAFLIYCAVIFAIFSIISLKNPDKFVFKQDTQYDVVDVTLVDDKMESKEAEAPKERLEEDAEQAQASAPSLKDVFSEIPALDQKNDNKQNQEPPQEVKNDLKSKKQEIQQAMRDLSKQQEDIKKLQDKLKKVNQKLEKLSASINIVAKEILPNQDKGKYDEWIAEIYKILYENWDFSFYQKTSISVLVKITNRGDFSYSILRYSQFDEYNEKIQAMLQRLEKERFPPYPNGEVISIEVNFKSKEKNE